MRLNVLKKLRPNWSWSSNSTIFYLDWDSLNPKFFQFFQFFPTSKFFHFFQIFQSPEFSEVPHNHDSRSGCQIFYAAAPPAAAIYAAAAGNPFSAAAIFQKLQAAAAASEFSFSKFDSCELPEFSSLYFTLQLRPTAISKIFQFALIPNIWQIAQKNHAVVAKILVFCHT